MKALDVARTFEEIAPVESGLASDIQARVLGFRYGDPTREVTGVGVSWWMAMEVIEQAIERGFNMLLLHEPDPFRDPISNWYSTYAPGTCPINLKRQRLLLEHNISVYTAHSNWDKQPDVGMQPTFAKALGLTDEICRDKVVGIYRIEPVTFAELIEKVKAATGMKHLRVQGPRDRIIKTVALGFGSMGDGIDPILRNGADAGIFGQLREKSFMYVREADRCVIETSHVVSESIGFGSVVGCLKAKMPELNIEFLDIPFGYDWA